MVMRKQQKTLTVISGQYYPFTKRYLQEKVRFVIRPM